MNARPAISLNNGDLVLIGTDIQLLAAVWASCVVYKKDGWQNDAPFKPVEDLPSLIFIAEDRLVELDQKAALAAAKAEAEKKGTQWYEEYNKRALAEKRTKELEDQIALLKSVTTCTTKDEENPL